MVNVQKRKAHFRDNPVSSILSNGHVVDVTQRRRLSSSTDVDETTSDMSPTERFRMLNASEERVTDNGVKYMTVEDARLVANALEAQRAALKQELQHEAEVAINDDEALERGLSNIQYSVGSKTKRVPWIDHLSVVVNRYVEEGDNVLPDEDQKRETIFHDITTLGVNESLRRLSLLKVPFTRPCDFYAEMLKSDRHMHRVQLKLLEKQTRIKAVEERKKKASQKKFAKATKAVAIKRKQQQKVETRQRVEQWKQSKFKTPL